jgi:hypothetical protein
VNAAVSHHAAIASLNQRHQEYQDFYGEIRGEREGNDFDLRGADPAFSSSFMAR